MKVCENCSIEIYTKDGDNLCEPCTQHDDNKRLLANQRRKINSKAMKSAMRDLGLIKVRGSLGGTYYE